MMLGVLTALLYGSETYLSQAYKASRTISPKLPSENSNHQMDLLHT